MNMHLADHVEIFPQCRLWLAYFDGDSDESIAATIHDIAEAKFSTQDLHRWQQFRPATKKRQFLNSRLVVRAVLQKEFGNNADNITFDSETSGCPLLLSRRKNQVAQISLSHSANAVAIAISDGEYPVGVDIEVPELLRTRAIQLVAFHPHEQAWCNFSTGLESEALTTLWTMKESVWKSLREPGDIAFWDISINFDSEVPEAVISGGTERTAQFRTQVFVQQSVPVAPGTLHLSTGNVPLRGCVAQRIAP